MPLRKKKTPENWAVLRALHTGMYRLPTDVLRYIHQMDPTYREQYKLMMAELKLKERHAVFECYQHKKRSTHVLLMDP